MGLKGRELLHKLIGGEIPPRDEVSTMIGSYLEGNALVHPLYLPRQSLLFFLFRGAFMTRLETVVTGEDHILLNNCSKQETQH